MQSFCEVVRNASVYARWIYIDNQKHRIITCFLDWEQVILEDEYEDDDVGGGKDS